MPERYLEIPTMRRLAPVRSYNPEKRTFEAVWSAGARVMRFDWWEGEYYIEELDMSAEAVDLTRLNNGGPLLNSHGSYDLTDVIGVVERAWLEGGQGIASVRMSARADVAPIAQDVADGIVRNLSVGYEVLQMEQTEFDAETGYPIMRATRWMPYEISLVPMGADPDAQTRTLRNKPEARTRCLVQLRSPANPATPKEGIMPEVTNAPAAGNAATQDQLDAATRCATAAAHQRTADLLAAGRNYADQGGNELALELLADPTKTIEDFTRQMLEKMRGKSRPTATAQPAAGLPAYGQGARHLLMPRNKLRAFTQPLVYSDGGKMDPVEAAYLAGRWAAATIHGHQPSQQWCSERGIDAQLHRVMTSGVDQYGGFVVPHEMEFAIIDLRQNFGLARKLARVRGMGSDSKTIPRRKGGITAYFMAEDNAGVTASDKNWDNVGLNSKMLGALTLISSQLEEDSFIDLGDDLAFEMAWAFSQKEDQCWLVGDGTSTYGGMQGLNFKFEATAYKSRYTAASAHDTFPEYDATDLTGVMASLADFPGMNPVWVCSKVFLHSTFSRLKAAAGGNTLDSLQGGKPVANYLGYDVYTSDVMPKDPAADMTNKVNALFGDFSMSSSFGDRRGLTIQVLRERYAEKFQIGILGSERFDVVNHDLGDTTNYGPVAALYGGT